MRRFQSQVTTPAERCAIWSRSSLARKASSACLRSVTSKTQARVRPSSLELDGRRRDVDPPFGPVAGQQHELVVRRAGFPSEALGLTQREGLPKIGVDELEGVEAYQLLERVPRQRGGRPVGVVHPPAGDEDRDRAVLGEGPEPALALAHGTRGTAPVGHVHRGSDHGRPVGEDHLGPR